MAPLRGRARYRGGVPPTRPSLPPAVADTRRAVRDALAAAASAVAGGVVVGLSGGADSLALAAAVAFEAPRAGIAARAVVVDHGLQEPSAEVAARAAEAARGLGLDAEVVRVSVDEGSSEGLEAAARRARRTALADAAARAGAGAVLLGHTLDDQAETVLLGLARGAGARSLAGMAPARADEAGLTWIRPFLALPRERTREACAEAGLSPWHDPHNDDPRFARVRVRGRVLPVLEAELGPGIREALARTAEQAREDADAFDAMIHETIEDIVEHADAGIAISIAALAANPAALRHRIIRFVVESEFHASLSRRQTLEVARLATEYTGQGPIDLPGCRAHRDGARLVIVRAEP